MVRRSSLILAASLAVLSTLEPTFTFAVAAPAQHHNEVEKPRFLRREIKRQFLNTTTSIGPGGYRGPFGGESTSDLKSLTYSLTTPPETTEAAPETTTATVHTSTPDVGRAQDSQSSQPGMSQSTTAEQSSQAQSQTPPSTSASPLTSTPEASVESQVTTSAAPATPPSVTPSDEGATTRTSKPVGNTETSAVVAPSETQSSESAVNGIPTPSLPLTSQPPVSQSTGKSDSVSTGSSPSQSTPPTMIGTTTAGGEQTLPSATQSSDASSPTTESTGSQQPLPTVSTPTVSIGSSPTKSSDSQQTLPSVSLPTVSIGSQSSGSQQTLPSVSLPIVSIGSQSSGSQQTPVTVTPETQPSTGITARTASSITSESQPTNAGQPSETHLSSGEQRPTSVTPSSAPQHTNSGAAENGPSNTVSGTKVNGAGQQNPFTTPATGPTQPSVSQEQLKSPAETSIPNVINTSQQPFSQPAQTRTGQEGGSLTHTTALPEGSSTNPIANTIIPSVTTGIILPPGETSKGSPVSSNDNTPPNAQTSANTVTTANSGTEASLNTRTTPNEIIPTASLSGGVSVGASPSQSGTNEAQPASSPSLPESVLVLPTQTGEKPLVTSGVGETRLPVTVVQQSSSNAGVVLPGSQSSAATALNTVSPEGSTPTGTQLYSALTAALKTTVGPGSSMLPNGVIVPTASSAEAGDTASSQLGQGNSAVGPGSGAASITLQDGSVIPNRVASVSTALQSGIPSITLPGGSVPPATILSEGSGVASITLSGGSVILNPSASNPLATILSEGSGVASITLSSGSVILNPSASNPPATILSEGSGVASITLSGGSVILNPSASNPPATILSKGSSVAPITLPSGSVILNPSVSNPSVSNPPVSNPPATILSEGSGVAPITLPSGSVILNPSVSNPSVSNPPATILSEGSGVASITLPGGSVVANPFPSTTAPSSLAAFMSDGVIVSSPKASIAHVTSEGVALTNSLGSVTIQSPVLPASITLPDGSVIQNPSATISPSGIALSNGQIPTVSLPASATASFPAVSETGSGPVSTNPPVSYPLGSSTIGAAVSNSAQGSVSLPQASSTDSNGAVIPIPVQSTAPVNTGAIDTGAVQSKLPVNSGTAETGPVTLSNGGLVSGTATFPVSATLATGVTSPIVVGSATNSNGDTVPITAGQLTGSSTLSGGAVVPLTASNPSLTSGVPVSSGGVSGSTTLPNGAIVPAASGNSSPTALGSALGTESAGQTGTGETAGSQNSAGQTTGATGPSGAGSTAVPQSGSQPAPAPVTGTATGPPSTVGSSPAQLTDATNSQNFPSDGKGPFTQQATSYDTDTVQSVPTSILAQPSSTLLTSQSSYSGPTGLPTGVPLVLYPSSGDVARPPNTDLIQIGFLYPLNYDFVWQHLDSQQQIFKYLPRGIAWGLQIDIENVTMQSLRAWDTTQDLHYITTIAIACVPSGQVDSLGLLVHTPTSRFYHTPDNSTNTLLSMINIALPIAADNSTDGGDSTSFGAVPSSTATMKDGGAPVGGGIGSTNPVRASSVGIACGVAAGAAAYGAAMFLVARRYRKKRQSHLRSPSMFSSPVMSHIGPDAGAGAALMSGGVGDHRSPSPYHDEDARAASRGSGRSASTGRQQISAPVMAENSLGWN